MYDALNDDELDALVKFKTDGKLDDATLNNLSDSALDALVELKKTPKTTEPKKEVFTDNIDHSIVPTILSPEEQKAKKEKQDNDSSFIDGVKKFGKKVKRDFIDPLLIGADNVVNIVSPVEVKMTDSPTLRTDINEKFNSIGEDDVDFDTYKKIGQLSKIASGFHDIGLGEVSAEDVATYNENLHSLLVERLGYADVGQADDGKYYVTDKEGKVTQLNKDTVKTVLGELLGDKAEMIGAMLGAKKGYDIGKVGGTKGKIAGALLGGATGAGLGNIGDQLIGAIETGEKLSMGQRLDEIGKSVVLDAGAAVVGGAALKLGGMAIKPAKEFISLIKESNLNEELQKNMVKEISSLPESEQIIVRDALAFAKENDMQLTTTSIINHPQADQFVQVLARNPFIRKAILKKEDATKNKILERFDSLLEDAGPKATAEELDPLLKQELNLAKNKRSKEVKRLYDDFNEKVSGQVVTNANTMMKEIKEEIGGKYGFLDQGEIFDPEIKEGLAYIDKLISPRANNGRLDVTLLNKVSSQLGRKSSNSKLNSPPLSAFLGEAKKRVDDEIELLSKYENDDIEKALTSARTAYREKSKIFGNKSEYTEIRNAIESDRPNEAIEQLLSGAKGLDNANILNQELSQTKEGKALLGALGRKILDDAMEQVDKTSSTSISKAFSSEKMNVAKRLLGEKKSQEIQNMAKLLEMLGRTEKLLAGTGADIATSSNATLTTQTVNGIKKMLVRFQQKRLFGKIFDNTIAQDLLFKSLDTVLKAKKPIDLKKAENYLMQSAKTFEKSTKVDFSDIYDKRKIKQAVREEKRAANV